MKPLLLVGLLSVVAWADQVEPYSSLRPHAPLEVHKGERPDPSLTLSERKEIAGEFRGILSLGYHSYAFDRWPGKDMGDCHSGGSGMECGQCDLITGHAHTYFTFYKDANKTSCTLQQVDVHFQVSDPAGLKELRSVGRDLLGGSVPATKPQSRENGWDGTGSGYKWEGETDLAYLYMNMDEDSINGQGVARFQWRRAPLYQPH
jgi:hypothetical protein